MGAAGGTVPLLKKAATMDVKHQLIDPIDDRMADFILVLEEWQKYLQRLRPDRHFNDTVSHCHYGRWRVVLCSF